MELDDELAEAIRLSQEEAAKIRDAIRTMTATEDESQVMDGLLLSHAPHDCSHNTAMKCAARRVSWLRAIPCQTAFEESLRQFEMARSEAALELAQLEQVRDALASSATRSSHILLPPVSVSIVFDGGLYWRLHLALSPFSLSPSPFRLCPVMGV
jgi:hypothetical protein